MRERGGLLAQSVSAASHDGATARWRRPASAPPAAADDYALLVEAIHEGYLLHYAAGRVVQPEDPDLSLLGRRPPVRARAGPARRAGRPRGGGRAGRRDLARGPGAGRGRPRAGGRDLGGGACAPWRRSGTGPRGREGAWRRMAGRPPTGSIPSGHPGPRVDNLPRVPQPRRTPPKSKYTSDRLIPGAFEGETVTRRRLMGLTVQGAGAVAVMGLHAARARLRDRLGRVRAPARRPGRPSVRPTTSRTTPTSRR